MALPHPLLPTLCLVRENATVTFFLDNCSNMTFKGRGEIILSYFQVLDNFSYHNIHEAL